MVFFDLLGFGIILPYLPFWAQDLGASGLGLGVVLTAYSGAQLAGAAIFGRMSDRLGRRPVIILTLAGSSLAMVGSALAPTLVLLAAARAVAGLFGGSISTAQAYIADVTGPAERARFMGLLGAAIGSGFVIGPAFGAVLLSVGASFSHTALLAAALAAVNLLFALLLLREPERERVAFSSLRPAPQVWLEALRRRDQGPVLTSIFLITLAFVAMETTFAYFAQERFGMGARGFAMTMVGLGLVLVLVQGGLIGPLSSSFGLRALAVVGVLSMAVSLFLVPLGPTLAVTLGILSLLAFGRGLASPVLSTLLSQFTVAEEQGAILGVGQSLSAAARAVGPVLAGSLYDLQRAGPFVASGVVCLAAALLLLRAGSAAKESAGAA